MNMKIAVEERKLLIAQRKLESIRLLDELFERVKINKQRELVKKKEETLGSKSVKDKQKKEEKMKRKKEKDKNRKDKLQDKERELRTKLVRKYKSVQEQQLQEQREKLIQTIEGKNKLRSVLASTSKKPDRGDHSSMSSISSSDDTKDKSSASDSTDLMSANGQRETSWKEKQDFDGKNYHAASQCDRHWYQNKHYFEDSQSYIYPYDDRGAPPMYPDFFKNYQRLPSHNLRFHHRGGFYPRRRGFYTPRWQKYTRGGRGSYRNFQARGFPSNASCYYDNITNDYYRYFQKLAKGSKEEESSDTQSQKSESINRSRSSKHSRLSSSESRSLSRTSRSEFWSQSRSCSRSLSHKRSRSQSRSWSQRKSRSRTRSHSRTHSKTRTKSPSQSVTHSKWNDSVAKKSAAAESASQSKDEKTRHSHSKKKKKRHQRNDVCNDTDKVRVKHKR